jgi:tetratricopeptide (TPR) repeat protein
MKLHQWRLIFLVMILILADCPHSVIAADKKSEAWHHLIDKGDEAESARNFDVADAWYRIALKEAEKQGSSSKQVRALSQLVRNRLDSKKLAETEPFFGRILQTVENSRRSRKYDPEMLVWVQDTADAYYSRAELSENPVAREFCVKHCIDCKLAVAERFDPEVWSRIGLLQTSYAMQGRYPEAVLLCDRAFEYLLKTRPNDVAAKTLHLDQIANLALVSKQLSKAENFYKQEQQLSKSAGVVSKSHDASLEREFGTIQLWQGNLESARMHYGRALQFDEEVSGKKSFACGLDNYALGILAEKLRKDSEAERFFQTALGTFDASAQSSPGQVEQGRKLQAADHLSKVLYRQGKKALAGALEKRVKQLRSQHPEWAKVSNPAPEDFFLVWGFLPYPIDYVPSRSL